MIRIDNVSKSFGQRHVLRDCTIEVNEGETLVVIGSSGTGKSTLLRIIIGLLEPDKGTVFVDGKNVHALRTKELRALRVRMGYLFQSGALINWLTVGENVALPLRENFRWTKAKIAEKVDHVLELVGLTGSRDLLPDQISGGMRKRAGLARSLVTDPEIILYDEPTTGLDPVTAHIIDRVILDLKEKLQVTSVVVSHDMAGTFRVADKVAMLYDGRIIAQGLPQDFQDSADPLVRQFVTGALEGPLSDSTPSGRRRTM